jgi:Cytochrome oxidase complex assembly protein 1
MDASQPSKSDNAPVKKGMFWRIVRIVFVALIALGIFFGIIIWRSQVATKQKNLEDTVLQDLQQPKKIALDAVAADSGAKELLGNDIHDTGGLVRDGSGELDRSNTVLHFDVAGSKQQGRVTAHATDKGGWQITAEIELKAADGKAIVIPKPAEKPPDIEF